jgi:hypothetical protein
MDVWLTVNYELGNMLMKAISAFGYSTTAQHYWEVYRATLRTRGARVVIRTRILLNVKQQCRELYSKRLI